MKTSVELWYINTVVKNPNEQVYLDLINDIRSMRDGVFNCDFKLNDGVVCDYVITESVVYADPTTTKAG